MGLSQFSHGNIGFTGRDRDLSFVGRIVVRSALAIRNLHLIFRQSSPRHLFGGDYFGHYPAICTCGLQMTLTYYDALLPTLSLCQSLVSTSK